jgi:hypothetical protein
MLIHELSINISIYYAPDHIFLSNFYFEHFGPEYKKSHVAGVTPSSHVAMLK